MVYKNLIGRGWGNVPLLIPGLTDFDLSRSMFLSSLTLFTLWHYFSVASIQSGPVETAFATNVSTNKLGSVPGMTEESTETDPLAKALQEQWHGKLRPSVRETTADG